MSPAKPDQNEMRDSKNEIGLEMHDACLGTSSKVGKQDLASLNGPKS